jgi:hypothetical protein
MGLLKKPWFWAVVIFFIVIIIFVIVMLRAESIQQPQGYLCDEIGGECKTECDPGLNEHKELSAACANGQYCVRVSE